MSTESFTDLLFSYWLQTLQSFAVNTAAANKTFLTIVSLYSTPNRHYHTLQHIHSVLNTIDTLRTYVQDLPCLRLAAWFHDIVYDTYAQDNEQKSADYAGDMLRMLAIPNADIAKVKSLILCTKNHQANDIDSQVLLDADLAILGTNPVEYQKYAQVIRQEYAWVS
jgi:predicted metal-dependent HD superfamily phosphohydrolase